MLLYIHYSIICNSQDMKTTSVPLMDQWLYIYIYISGDAGSIPGSGRSLKKEMATHFNILAWEIPRTEEPGRLQES